LSHILFFRHSMKVLTMTLAMMTTTSRPDIVPSTPAMMTLSRRENSALDHSCRLCQFANISDFLKNLQAEQFLFHRHIVFCKCNQSVLFATVWVTFWRALHAIFRVRE
jgi:hypothetical protein